MNDEPDRIRNLRGLGAFRPHAVEVKASEGIEQAPLLQVAVPIMMPRLPCRRSSNIDVYAAGDMKGIDRSEIPVRKDDHLEYAIGLLEVPWQQHSLGCPKPSQGPGTIG